LAIERQKKFESVFQVQQDKGAHWSEEIDCIFVRHEVLPEPESSPLEGEQEDTKQKPEETKNNQTNAEKKNAKQNRYRRYNRNNFRHRKTKNSENVQNEKPQGSQTINRIRDKPESRTEN